MKLLLMLILPVFLVSADIKDKIEYDSINVVIKDKNYEISIPKGFELNTLNSIEEQEYVFSYPDSSCIYIGNFFHTKNEPNINNIINIKDMLLLRVANVDEINRVKLTLRSRGLGKFNQGTIIKVKQPTIHFLSEENAFLTTMIQEYTYTDVIIGKNGLIWINGLKENIERIIEIIELIEKEEPLKHNLIKHIQSMILNPK